jgi:hypothetical protein
MTHRFLQAASTTRRILFFLSATPTSNLTHLDEPTMENKETIICWFYNDKSSFHVDICPEKTISHLKEAILAKEPSISVTSASQLQLWVANIDDTEEAMGSFSFDGLKTELKELAEEPNSLIKSEKLQATIADLEQRLNEQIQIVNSADRNPLP